MVRKALDIREAFEEDMKADDKCWERGLTSDLCVPGLKYSDTEGVPSVFRSQKVGNFGRIINHWFILRIR